MFLMAGISRRLFLHARWRRLQILARRRKLAFFVSIRRRSRFWLNTIDGLLGLLVVSVQNHREVFFMLCRTYHR